MVLVAHEVSSVVPEAITGAKDAMQVATKYTADDDDTRRKSKFSAMLNLLK